MKHPLLALAVAAAASVAAGAALAHHSFSMFDQAKTVTLAGSVKSLDIVNPHSWLNIVVVSDAGRSAEWAFEMGGPGQLQAQGWSGASVKPGDSISVRMHPLLDGSNGGQLVSATIGGKTLYGQPGARGGQE